MSKYLPINVKINCPCSLAPHGYLYQVEPQLSDGIYYIIGVDIFDIRRKCISLSV